MQQKPSILQSILLVALCMPLLAIAQTLQFSPEKIKSLDSLFRSQYAATEPGVITIVAKDGKPLYRKAYGMSNLELSVPLNTEHKMGIGSISKQFAAVSILLLQQDGKLDIRDDIRKYLPTYNTYGRRITIENLLSHTSGIPSYTELYGFDTLANREVSNQTLVKFFEARPPIFEPGANWSYSNSGYVLAAIIVEKISGMAYNDFLQERIFKPLMMTETTLGSSDFLTPGKTGEYNGLSPRGRIKMETQYHWYWAYGAGQIVSTVDDMLKWDEALYNPDFLRPELRELAFRSFILKDGTDAHYGLGWAIDNLGSKTVVRHGGSIGGYRAEGIRVPGDHLYLLVLSNTGSTNSGLLANKMITILYDMPAIKENRNVQQSWKEIEGVYESPNAGLRLQLNFGSRPSYYTIRVDSVNRVTAQRTGGTVIALSPAGKDLLFDKNNPYNAWNIVRNSQGSVEGIQFQHYFPMYGPERFNKRVSSTIPAARVIAKADSVMLLRYRGAYEHPFGDRLKIFLEKNQLFMETLPFGNRTPLHWIQGNTFLVKETDMEVIFDADKKGNITGIRFHNGFAENLLRKVEEIY